MKKIELIIGVSGAITGLCALLFSVYSFNLQQNREHHRAVKNSQPILKIRTVDYDNRLEIKLINAGIGPAIIKEASFEKDTKKTNKIYELLRIGVPFETYINIPKKTILKENEERVLALVSKEQGYSEEEFGKIKNKWRSDKSGIKVNIQYEDIYGNPYGPYKLILK